MSDYAAEPKLTSGNKADGSANQLPPAPNSDAVEEFFRTGPGSKALSDIQRDLARTQNWFNRAVDSKDGADIDEAAGKFSEFIERTEQRIDRIDGKKDGQLEIPGQETINIRDSLSDWGLEPDTLKEDAADLLRDNVDLNENGRITRAEIDTASAYKAAENKVWDKARAEGWADDKVRLRDELVAATLPEVQARTDLSNPDATRSMREVLLSQDGVRKVDKNYYPELASMAQDATKKLNAENEQSFVPPTVVIKTGLFDATGSPASYFSDAHMIGIDAEYAEAFKDNPQVMDGVIGHEVGHAYERTPEDLKASLHKNYSSQLGIPMDPKQLAVLRENETKADAAGARVVGNKNMAGDLKTTFDWMNNGGQTPVSESAEIKTPDSKEALTPAVKTTNPNQVHPDNDSRIRALLADFKPCSGVTYNEGAPPHCVSASAPPAVKNEKAAQTQQVEAGGAGR